MGADSWVPGEATMGADSWVPDLLQGSRMQFSEDASGGTVQLMDTPGGAVQLVRTAEGLSAAATPEGSLTLGEKSEARRRRLAQEEPDVRGRRPPPAPPKRICDYGDPFRMGAQGGCCQVCKMAAAKYSHYKDSDLSPSARAP